MKWVQAGLFLGLLVFHLGTLGISSTYSPLFDEIAIADFSYHDSLLLWERVIPKAHKNLLNSYGWALWNGEMKTQGWILHRIGPGILQSRIGPALAALLALLLIALIPAVLGLPWYCPVGVLLFGFTRPFFNAAHSIRPEGFVLLAMGFNWLWFFRGGGRLWSVAAGCCAAGAFAFHQEAIFVLIPMPIMLWLRHGKKILDSSRCYWWVVGVLLGAIYVADVVDMDRGMQFLQFGRALQAPPILRLGREPLGVLADSLRYFFFASKQGYGWHFLLSAMLLVLGAQAWEHRRLPAPQRELLAVAVLTTLSFCLCSASIGAYYFVLLAPWLLLSFLAGVELLLRRSIELRRPHQMLLCAAQAAVFAVLVPRFWFLPVFSMLLCLLFYSDRRLAFGAGALAVTAAGLSFDISSRIVYLAQYRPLLLLMIVALPWILLPRVEQHPARWCFKKISFEPIFLACCLASFALVLLDHLQFLSWQTDISRISDEQLGRLLSLRGEKRLLAPSEFWLYAPSVPLQSVDALMRNQRDLDVGAALLDYDPTFILWPADQRPMLEGLFAVRARAGARLQWGATWRMPTGEWRELRIIR